MSRPSQERVREELRAVVDPCSAASGLNLDIVEMGLIEDLRVADGTVRVDMRLTTPACTMVGYFMTEIEERVEPLPGVEEVTVTTDAGFEWNKEMMAESAKQKRAEARARRREAADHDRPRPETSTPEQGRS